MFAIAFALSAQISQVPLTVPIPEYDCDASPGKFRRLDLSGDPFDFRFSGKLRVETLGADTEKWTASAGILFENETDKGVVGLHFWRFSKKKLSFGLRKSASDLGSPEEIGTVSAKKPIEFVVALNRSGKMNVEVNGHTYAVLGVTVSPTRPYLVCSGGNFIFENLEASKGIGL